MKYYYIKSWATSVPALAVIQGGLALFIIIRRKGYVGDLFIFDWKFSFFVKTSLNNVKICVVKKLGEFLMEGWNPKILKRIPKAKAPFY